MIAKSTTCGIYLLSVSTHAFSRRRASVPATVVVGGQYGSEGKGKVAHDFAKRTGATVAVRVGGSNAGHTAYDAKGRKQTFRHLPTAALLSDVLCVLGPGSLIDPDVLCEEVQRIALPPKRLRIDPMAFVITEAHKNREAAAGIADRIGSTASGTGAALVDRLERLSDENLARAHPLLRQYVVGPVRDMLRTALERGEQVLVEGTQGFGLSNLQSPDYPKATSRDTTAGTFTAEAGLSPLDVTEVVLVIRAYPIRVAGNSGPLPSETTWANVDRQAGREQLVERTTVTGRIRRVAHFDAGVVRAAITANAPTCIVLNHLDYVRTQCVEFVEEVEASIGRSVDWLGTSPRDLEPRHTWAACCRPVARRAPLRATAPPSGIHHGE